MNAKEFFSADNPVDAPVCVDVFGELVSVVGLNFDPRSQAVVLHPDDVHMGRILLQLYQASHEPQRKQ